MFLGRGPSPPVSLSFAQRETRLLGAAAACQGARDHMEDEHLLLITLPGGMSPVYLSAVFDGHAGKEVSLFLRHRIQAAIQATEGWMDRA